MYIETERSDTDAATSPSRWHGTYANADARFERVESVLLPATKQFDAALKFRKDSNRVAIAILANRFRTHLQKKLETNVPKGVLRVNTLCEPASDISIIGALGERSIIYLADLWHLLSLHKQGEGNILVDDGRTNICYVRGVTETFIWAVHMQYRKDYDAWCIGASPITCPFQWPAGNRVLSR